MLMLSATHFSARYSQQIVGVLLLFVMQEAVSGNSLCVPDTGVGLLIFGSPVRQAI